MVHVRPRPTSTLSLSGVGHHARFYPIRSTAPRCVASSRRRGGHRRRRTYNRGYSCMRTMKSSWRACAPSFVTAIAAGPIERRFSSSPSLAACTRKRESPTDSPRSTRVPRGCRSPFRRLASAFARTRWGESTTTERTPCSRFPNRSSNSCAVSRSAGKGRVRLFRMTYERASTRPTGNRRLRSPTVVVIERSERVASTIASRVNCWRAPPAHWTDRRPHARAFGGNSPKG
jgi:hypothetical protein